MAGKEFETYVAWLLRRQGYRVEEIGGYEDMGVDLVATNTKGIRHAIQVKCWNAREVDMNAVRAAIAGVAIHNCQRAVVITNNYFTRKAKELAEANNCKLIDRDTLADQINRLQSSALQLTEEANQ
jgi:restriction system protein